MSDDFKAPGPVINAVFFNGFKLFRQNKILSIAAETIKYEAGCFGETAKTTNVSTL